MRAITDINLTGLIFHILETNQGGRGLVLSQRDVPNDAAGAPIFEYVKRHILNSLKDNQAQAAKFVTVAPNLPSGICGGLLSGHTNLVDASTELATRLFGILSSDHRISAGDLGVCTFSDNDVANSIYVAILKMDPNRGFTHRTTRDPQGREYVTLERSQSILPTVNERLQKCAFVQPRTDETEYDMMLLDRQTESSQGEGIARFFVRDFLDAALALDDRARTERFYRAAIKAQNLLRLDLTGREEESLRLATDVAVRSETLDVNAWLEALPLRPEIKESVSATIAEALPDQRFTIDVDFGTKLTRKRKFRGDGDLRLEVAADRFDEIVTVTRQDPTTGPAFWRIVIETERWDETNR